MCWLLLHTPVLQRRAFYHACLFGSFSLFWTVAPLLLADRFGLSQNVIALLAAVGMACVLATSVAGRVADRGWTQPATGLATVVALLALQGASGSFLGLLAVALAAVLLDLGVTANGVLGRRAINALSPALRGRLNGLYMATFSAGGALGSAAGGWGSAKGGWGLATAFALAPALAALACFATELREISL